MTCIDGVDRKLFDEVCKVKPNIDSLRLYLSDGADVNYRPVPFTFPTLHRCVLMGHVEALKELLTTKRKIHMNAKEDTHFSALHCVCGHMTGRPAHQLEEMKEMTAAIISRLHSHPADQVWWDDTDDEGLDFLSLAAKEGVLFDLYPLVKNQEYYLNAPKPLVLSCAPCNTAWKKLDVENEFTVSKDGFNYALMTEILKVNPDISFIKLCVRNGADILYKGIHNNYPVLHCCVKKASTTILKELLQTHLDVNFSVLDEDDQNPLHGICDHFDGGPPAHTCAMVEMTSAVVTRLASHPGDYIDSCTIGSPCRGVQA